jgi:hypothetical protein
MLSPLSIENTVDLCYDALYLAIGGYYGRREGNIAKFITPWYWWNSCRRRR